ncbi:MAG: 2-oxoacid:acceptor oxidoreductase family protein [Chloroflexi bacterium]|nr:2-oxoacid:acceptor oxidoreductase family protein [Chloroflexota bacterium]
MSDPEGYWEVQMVGVGGQGLALAGLILAEAAGIHEGWHVAMTESHGVNVRGGPSRAEVIISRQEIDYPCVRRPHILVAFTEKDAQRLGPLLRQEGILIADSTIPQLPDLPGRAVSLPLTQLAQELGDVVVAGIVALAAMTDLTGVVSWGTLEAAVLARVPPRAKDMNLRALEAGRRAAAEGAPLEGQARRRADE